MERPPFGEFFTSLSISTYAKKIFQNPLKDRPADWDVLLTIALPNYAMLDQLEAKAAALYSKHYGSPEASAAAGKKRGELREVISMRLVREVSLK